MDLVWSMKPQATNRKTYPSDISGEQYELIRPDLENFKHRTKPRDVDLYDVFCGVLYVLKSGCQWRMLPSDFHDWNVVYSYYSQWGTRKAGKPSLLEQGLKKIGWRGPHRPWEERTNELRHH